jgi:hypothetical protein
MEPDPIVEEVHRIRAELLARFNGDLHALVEDARRRQAESGRPTVTFRKETVPPETGQNGDPKPE